MASTYRSMLTLAPTVTPLMLKSNCPSGILALRGSPAAALLLTLVMVSPAGTASVAHF